MLFSNPATQSIFEVVLETAEYFAEDLPLLKTFIEDGLVENTADFIKVDQKARLLIRNICMGFDAYMKKHVNQQRFSRVI